MNIISAKRRHAIVFAIAVIMILMWSAWRVLLFSPIPEKPEDTLLEFWIIENVEGTDWIDHDTPYGMYGGEAYLGKDYPLELTDGKAQIPEEHVIYTVTPWPDYSDDSAYVTGIEITDPAISVYGLTVNSSFEEFDRVFCRQGYNISIDKNEYWESHSATKNDITFSLVSGTFCEGSESESIFTISAAVTNRDGVVF